MPTQSVIFVVFPPLLFVFAAISIYCLIFGVSNICQHEEVWISLGPILIPSNKYSCVWVVISPTSYCGQFSQLSDGVESHFKALSHTAQWDVHKPIRNVTRRLLGGGGECHKSHSSLTCLSTEWQNNVGWLATSYLLAVGRNGFLFMTQSAIDQEPNSGASSLSIDHQRFIEEVWIGIESSSSHA